MLTAVFACVSVAALQAVVLAIGGARVFARLTASAQLLLTSSALAILLFGPAFGAAAVDFVKGGGRSDWAMWLPPIWFAGVYELVNGNPEPAIAFGALISEIGIRSVDFVPYTRSYSPERGRLQAR